MVDRLPRVLIALEGVAVAFAAVVLYLHFGYAWWLLVALALAPDLSALGYIWGRTVGAATYDAAHTYAVPVVLTTLGTLAGTGAVLEVGLIWLAHIGVDRAVGYGLKYPTSFKHTHLQRI